MVRTTARSSPSFFFTSFAPEPNLAGSASIARLTLLARPLHTATAYSFRYPPSYRRFIAPLPPARPVLKSATRKCAGTCVGLYPGP